jgi:glycosyltransferase involved in cell wall biosynthesis
VHDLRWFAPNAYTTLIVPELRRLGLAVATEGDAPARVAFAMSGLAADKAWRWARQQRAKLIVYLWDLPPQGTGRGRPDPVWWIGGRFVRLPRPWGAYGRRRGYYSRLRLIAAGAAGLWAPRAFTAATVRAGFALAAERVPYCYDSDRFVVPDAADVHKVDPPLVLTVSRLRPHKNQALVLHAAALLGPSVRVRLIGRGPEAGALEALAQRLGVACEVETAADDAAVTRAYREAAVAVCPSRFEGFGLTPIEAIASGVPVVASDIPPHREFVGGAARLVPPNDPAALAEALHEALRNATPADPSHVAALTIGAAALRFRDRIRHFLE